ncbi:MAG TPA: peptidylprolyl isomerase, partial [Sphingomonas sp.]
MATKTRALRAIGMALAATLGGAALAQTVADQTVPDTGGLNIPTNLQIFGKVDPNVRKATAIVNETVITGTDVDQRIALIEAANNTKIAGEDRDRLKLQVLRQLIDETLQIQEAKAAEITITQAELDQSFTRIAANFKQQPAQFREFLRQAGSSERSMRRQIEGELAWQRYLRRRVEPFVAVGDLEVKSILDRLEQSKGTTEYNVREIYLSAPGGREAEVAANARRVIEELRKGQQPFDYFARNFSEATTRSTGGDLGWVRGETLPSELAQAVAEMQPGQVAGPIEVPGGFSILFLADKRQVLTADP